MGQEEIFLVCLFGVVAAIAYVCCGLVVRDNSSRLFRRLSGGSSQERRDGDATGPSILTKLGQAVAKPFEPHTREKQSALRRRLGQAGFYSIAAMRLFISGKVVALAGGALAGFSAGAAMGQQWLGLSMGGLMGYVAPTLWLNWQMRKHQRELEHALPDALDLLVVCAEAGLTTDAALQRVGREIALPHPALARELAIAHAETQMGLPRADALRNLAGRTGSPSIQSLTAVLIQTDRFGTGIAQGLRVHAESLRLKRQYAAEEMAAKTSVKLIFPVALLIFPTVLLVLIGPAIIQMIMTGFLKR